MSDNFIHTEATFESAIVDHLCNNGWQQGNANDFSKDLAFDKKTILNFVQSSQSAEWKKLKQYYNGDTESKFIQRLFKNLT